MRKPGEYVTVYKDAFLQRKEEGTAYLLKKICEDARTETWLMEFVCGGERVVRRIARDDNYQDLFDFLL